MIVQVAHREMAGFVWSAPQTTQPHAMRRRDELDRPAIGRAAISLGAGVPDRHYPDRDCID